MTVTNSPRWGAALPKFSNGTDSWLARGGWNAFADMFETLVAQATQGLASARPAASATNPRRFYYATDTNILSYDTGGTWQTISPTGGFGIPNIFSAAGTEGTDARSARGDHRHPSPLIYTNSLSGVQANAGITAVASTGTITLLGSGTHRLEARVSGSLVMSGGGAGSAQLNCTGTTAQTWKASVSAGVSGEGSDYGGSRPFTATGSVSLNFTWQRTGGSNVVFSDPTVIQIFDWGI